MFNRFITNWFCLFLKLNILINESVVLRPHKETYTRFDIKNTFSPAAFIHKGNTNGKTPEKIKAIKRYTD